MSTETPPAVIEPTAPDTEPQPGRASRWLILCSLALAAALLYFTLSGLDWGAFWQTVRHGRYAILLIVIPIASTNYFLRAVRWSILVRTQKSVSVLSVFWANMVGYMGNAYLPARAGEVLRSVYLGRPTGLGTSYVLATALAERLMDAVSLVLIGSVALLIQSGLPEALERALQVMAVGGCAGLALILLAPFQERLIVRAAGWLPLPRHISGLLAQQISRFLLGMRSLHSPRRLLTFVALTAVIWLLDAFANTVGARVISQSLSMGQALVLLAGLGLSSAIPSTPGYVGVYQFVAAAVLVPFGFTRAEALAYILMSQVINYVVVTVWGLIGVSKVR